MEEETLRQQKIIEIRNEEDIQKQQLIAARKKEEEHQLFLAIQNAENEKKQAISKELSTYHVQALFTYDNNIDTFLFNASCFADIVKVLRGYYDKFTIHIRDVDDTDVEIIVFQTGLNNIYLANATLTKKLFKDESKDTLDDEISKYIYCLTSNLHINKTLEYYEHIFDNIGKFEHPVQYEGDVEAFFRNILIESDYSSLFEKGVDVHFNNGLLLIDYDLPSIDIFPNVKGYKYISTKNEISKTMLSDSFIAKCYEASLYKICIRSLYELFSLDNNSLLKVITFNGYVEAINRAKGRKERKCIMSIQSERDHILELNIREIDAKICFKNLKGVSAAKLIDITPITPILSLNKDDKRFINSYDVSVNDSTNLAAMNWEDFEHLVRIIFEKEFSSNGGEVKVTQSSRDGGVDAIAFDPDPIRGGKIIIQAKRYTNTVGVSAVRDLYGTVINEGANRGILITTSDYGHDSYEFAKDKPITLLNGGHLLGLLRKQGQSARINIEEAKNM